MFKLVGLFALVSVAYAAVALYPPEEKPAEFADQEGCYISKLQTVLPYDQLYYPPQDEACVAYNCQKINNITQEYSCGAVATQEGCTLSEKDLTKKYPDCCPMEVCNTITTPATTTPATTSPTTTSPTTSQPTGQGSSAYAYARSESGQPPITQTSTSGPDAQASASAT